MNEQTLSLAEAIAEMQSAIIHVVFGEDKAITQVVPVQDALAILARVEQDEEGMAVLWLIRRGWLISQTPLGWQSVIVYEHTTRDFLFSPIEEATNLGWKP
jgi:hypothetical protein